MFLRHARPTLWRRLLHDQRGFLKLPAGPCFETPGAGGGGGGGGEKQKGEGKLELTQKELDDLISSRLARERAIWERKTGGSADERDELERLRKAEKDRAEAEALKKGEFERVTTSLKDEHAKKEQGWQKERSDLVGEIRKDRCEGAIIAAAAEFNAYSPAQVAKLLSDRVDLDEARQVTVLGEDGKPVYKAGALLSVKELVKTFLDGNPHLVKATQTQGGSGSKGGASTTGTGAGPQTDLDTLKAELKDLEDSMGKGMPKEGDQVKAMKLRRQIKALEDKAKAA